jgi:hypothetical protein
VKLKTNPRGLVSGTIGWIKKLPHDLVASLGSLFVVGGSTQHGRNMKCDNVGPFDGHDRH